LFREERQRILDLDFGCGYDRERNFVR
jgi:hypothetical protein